MSPIWKWVGAFAGFGLLSIPTTEDCAVLHVPSPITDDLVADLKAVNGVEAVMNIRKYSATVERAELYTWEELRPAILAAAKRHTR